jgi:hypothetical protein
VLLKKLFAEAGGGFDPYNEPMPWKNIYPGRQRNGHISDEYTELISSREREG